MPTILGTEVSEITSSSAVLRAEAENVGSAQCGFLYGTDISLSEAFEIVGEVDDNGFSACLMGLQPLTTYYYSTYVKRNDSVVFGDVKTFTTDEQKKMLNAVDLGISIKWADVNLGAKSPEQIGDIYAWGETTTKEQYTWGTYKFFNEQDGLFSKYQVPVHDKYWDCRIYLEKLDDAAYCQAGEPWRTPTYDDWYELVSECDFEWTNNYLKTGVSGYLVRGRKEGFTNNCIFLPEASGSYSGSKNAYWSSSLDYSTGVNAHCFGEETSLERYYGLPIRPVCGTSRKQPVKDIIATPSEITIHGLGVDASFELTFLPENVRCDYVYFTVSKAIIRNIGYSNHVYSFTSNGYGNTDITICCIDSGDNLVILTVPVHIIEADE